MFQDDQESTELKENLKKMELSLSAIDDCILWVDEQGIIQWCNDCFNRLINIKDKAPLKQKISRILTLRNNNKIIDWMDILKEPSTVRNKLFELENGESQFFEMTVRPFYQEKGHMMMIVVLHNVTQKHLDETRMIKTNDSLRVAISELALTEVTKSKLASIVESTDDAIVGRALDGSIESWNKGAEKLYGYKAQEVLGKSIKILYPPKYYEEFINTNEQIKRNQTFQLTDTERVHKDGHIIPVSVTVSPIRNKDGEVVGSCSIARDITEWKKMANIKNDFISTVSHELRTPLTSIQGSLSLLLAGAAGELSDKACKLLAIGQQNTERLIRLINDILDIQKIESGKMEFNLELLNIDTLVKEAINANLAYADKHNIKIKSFFNFSETVHADRDRILQVLTNLISNAIKFSVGNSIKLFVCQKDNYVRVEVTNEGPGIPKEFYPQIFTRFSQASHAANRTKPGTGLGLSISKEIIEKHNGIIGFISEIERETTFYFELPIYKKTSALDRASKKEFRVAIYEDDKELANELMDLFENSNIKSVIVNNANYTRQAILDRTVDLLVFDLSMNLESVKFLKELKNINPELPIIAIASNQEKERRKLQGNAILVVDWIDKEVDFNRVLKAIKNFKKQTGIDTPSILHVEDDRYFIKIVENLLQHEANVTGVTTFVEAQEKLQTNVYDLVILDLLLPDGYGVDLLPQINEQRLPIIIFSGYVGTKEDNSEVIEVLRGIHAEPNTLLAMIKLAIPTKNKNRPIEA